MLEIFNKINVNSPVIFITSYDEYAIRAFKVNSIDYLLKPVKKEDLEAGVRKFRSLRGGTGADEKYLGQMEKLIRELSTQKREYRERFLVKSGQRYFAVENDMIAYFYSDGGLVHLTTWQHVDHILDYTLDDLESMLDPRHYFRANRQFILHIKSVKAVHVHFNHKLKVTLQPSTDKELLVSRERATDFKNWMGK